MSVRTRMVNTVRGGYDTTTSLADSTVMAHIEFLDPVPDPDVTPERAPAPGPPAPARRIPEAALRAAAGLGWLAAAGLSWAAAYSSMYTVTYGSGATAYSFTVDAWGRTRTPARR